MQPQLSDKAYWLGLSLIAGIGPKRMMQLKAYFGDSAAAWRASELALMDAGLHDGLAKALVAQRSRIDLAAEMRKVEQAGAWLLTPEDPRYSSLLREIDDAPVLLYVRGDILPQDDRALAVVGTRKPSRNGSEAAFELSRSLAENGVTIVSGMAVGIDGGGASGGNTRWWPDPGCARLRR
ncbi:DNA-processing protein DprA [bacterium]|nr:DNA-processing protein DprA [bacterium]